MEQTIKIYTDGSWSSKKPSVAGWSFLAVLDGKIIHCQYGQASAVSQQIGGELKGAMAGLLWAKTNGFSTIEICHDYTGVAHWAKGEWKPKKELPKKYAQFMKGALVGSSVSFTKVDAHTGDMFNELADQLAKKGVMEG